MDDAVSIVVHVDHVVVPDEAQGSLKAVKERMAKIRRLVHSHASMAASKIHRFPRGMRGIGGPDDRYAVPVVVSIGPYHHGQPHLQEMEEVKLSAVDRFCSDSRCSVDAVYAKLFPVVGLARRCYADDEAVTGISDADFAAMMLLDGCFLLRFMIDNKEPSFQGHALSSEYCILKDMMLLENQIPWLVLEVIMEFMHVDVRSFVADLGDKFFPKEEDKSCWSKLRTAAWPCRKTAALERSVPGGQNYKNCKPAHLLDLLWFSQIWHMPEGDINYEAGNASLLSSSAVELAQIGVKLTASAVSWFGDMKVVRKKGIFGEFLLSPVFLNDVTACWLVNMAALEATGGGAASGDVDYGLVVSSYLSALAMLMDREEDVHQLRGRRVVLSTFSNTQTLEFFKRIGQNLSFGGRYFVVLEQIEAYRRNRPVRTVVHKFVYDNYKVIGIILSIASVLVGIFKALRGH